MTTTYAWPEMRDRAIALFNGDTPGATIEATVLQHFRDHPGRVLTLIETIGRRVTEGQIRSGWAILAHELEQTPPDVKATDDVDRAKQIQLAEAWVRKTGAYVDSEAELIDELYGDRGRLRNWPETKPQIVALWNEQRPRFATAEQEAVERQARQADTLERLRKASRGAPNPDQHAELVQAEVERAHLAYLEQLAPDNDDA